MKIADMSDNQLVEQVKRGNNQAFEEIVSRYSDKAYSLANRMCRNDEDAEEVLQDVFVTVHRKLQSFEGKSSFSSWLYRVTVNASLMKLRKRRQEKALSIEDAIVAEEHSLAMACKETYQTDRDTLRKEIFLALEKAIAGLPEDYRPVYILRDVDGLSSREVSKILGLSIPAVKSRLHRSRLMLRSGLVSIYNEITASEKAAA